MKGVMTLEQVNKKGGGDEGGENKKSGIKNVRPTSQPCAGPRSRISNPSAKKKKKIQYRKKRRGPKKIESKTRNYPSLCKKIY